MENFFIVECAIKVRHAFSRKERGEEEKELGRKVKNRIRL